MLGASAIPGHGGWGPVILQHDVLDGSVLDGSVVNRMGRGGHDVNMTTIVKIGMAAA